jgi:hypothetical protein
MPRPNITLARPKNTTLHLNAKSLRRLEGYLPIRHTVDFTQTLARSSLGHSHVNRPSHSLLPPASPPVFPQLVVHADGSSFTHYTTSPRSVFKMNRDATNNPAWFPNKVSTRDGQDEYGRIAAFREKFANRAGQAEGDKEEPLEDAFAGEIEDWMEEGGVELKSNANKRAVQKSKRK